MINWLDDYLTKPKEERTWKDYTADAAGIVFIAGMIVLLWIVRGGIL